MRTSGPVGGSAANNQQLAAATNIKVEPKFFFGLKGDVTNNVMFVDDNTVIYPCGHNVVLYSINEKM